MPPKPTTAREYLASLPDDRREAIARMRKVVLDNLPTGYEESIGWGMLAYSVPLRVLPDTYNGQPLGYVAIGSQKNYMTVHLMPLYGDKSAEEWFRAEFKARGKKLKMGKACVRFTSIDDLPLDVIGALVAKYPMKEWVRMYRQSRSKKPASRPPATRAAGGTRAAARRAR